MKSEAEIMPTTDTVSASHSGALATPWCPHTGHAPMRGEYRLHEHHLSSLSPCPASL